MLWWLLACGTTTDPGAEREAYLRATSLAKTAPVEAAGACEEAGALRGECLATLLDHAPLSQAEEICERIGPGTWHDECWFMASERLARREEPRRAAELCERAGDFAEECLSHAWYAEALRLLRKEGAQEALDRYPVAWEWRSPGGRKGLRLMFWGKFFEASLNHPDTPALEVAWCAQLPLAPETCRGQMQKALRRDLHRLTQQGVPEKTQVLCDSSRPLHERVEDALGLTYVPHRTLDEIVLLQVRGLCGRR